MAFMDWTASLDLGVPAMDAEHKGLVAAMNRIYELGEQGANKATLDQAIQKLAELTTKHFADEEKHMASVGYPDLKTHAVIHKNMLEKFTALYNDFKAGAGKVDRAFYDFLKFWLKSHIMGIDRKYADHAAPVRR